MKCVNVICPRCGDAYRFCPTCKGPCVYDGNAHKNCERRPSDVLTVVGGSEGYDPDWMMNSVLLHGEKETRLQTQSLSLALETRQIGLVITLCACATILAFIVGALIGTSL